MGRLSVKQKNLSFHYMGGRTHRKKKPIKKQGNNNQKQYLLKTSTQDISTHIHLELYSN